jgi:hypothetical protein
MTVSDQKSDLRRYLQLARDAMVWKVDGLSEYDIRRPLTPTGTNLLGLIKHLTGGEIGYFGDTFGRPLAGPPPWTDDELLEREPMADMWATADESRDYIVGWYRKAWAHADKTFDALELDAIGHVPWWPGEHSEVDLHRILVHMIAETHRHAGHADISESSSTDRQACGQTAATCHLLTRRGGRITGLGWSGSLPRRAKPDLSRQRAER